MERDYFGFYRSFYDVTQMLPTEEERTTMLWAIIKLGLEDTIDEDLPLDMRMALKQMQATIRGAKNRHDRAVENGKKGGAPKGNQNARKNQKNNQNNLNSKTKENSKENLNDTSSDMAHLNEGQSYEVDADGYYKL